MFGLLTMAGNYQTHVLDRKFNLKVQIKIQRIFPTTAIFYLFTHKGFIALVLSVWLQFDKFDQFQMGQSCK